MTDADVDGSHIRTLLLTFFFRQYQELIDRGHLFIAQPPLYRAYSSKFEKFIKDDDELNSFLLNRASSDLAIRAADGKKLSGESVVALMRNIETISRRVSDVEMMGIPVALFVPLLMREERIESDHFTNHGDALATYMKAFGYSFHMDREEYDDTSREFAVFEDDNGHRTRIGMEFFNSRSYRQAFDILGGIRKKYTSLAFTLERKGDDMTADDIFKLLASVLEEARRGLSIQRYKGLGEMNPEQLWKTTMNPENRVLLRVEIEDAAEASEAFEELMGDRVEARREFIERNALTVHELDI
jgi:DNA gyrase subunit B